MGSAMYKTLIRSVTLAIVTTFSTSLWAQSIEFTAEFNQLEPQEQQRLRTILAEPTPQNALQKNLRSHFKTKEAAAFKLGDEAQYEIVLREAVRVLPDPVYKNNLSRRLILKGEFEEGNDLLLQAIATGRDAGSQFYIFLSNRVCDLVYQNKNAEARSAIADVTNQIKIAQSDAKTIDLQRTLFRSMYKLSRCLSNLEERLGRTAQAVELAERSEQNARKAFSMLNATTSALGTLLIKSDVAESIVRKLQAYRSAGRLQDAEKSLTELVRYAREVQLPTQYLSSIYGNAGDLRFSQREFLQAEQFFRQADAELESLGRPPLFRERSIRKLGVVMSLSGQKKWAEALLELDRMDQLAGNNAKLQQQVRFPFDRAVVYFGNNQFNKAASLFASHAAGLRKNFDEHHFLVAQSKGLQGAALWRSDSKANQARALPLLKDAVRDYMAPANADFLENIGYRKERREEIFTAYLEALTTTPGEDVTQAMGPADWVRGSMVQEALIDAAARAAASTPALAHVVRLEQDAKNEVVGLRRYLSGEAGSASLPLPVIAAQMRERIAYLENERRKLQAEIKTQFPEYAKLVHPSAPTLDEMAKQLEPHQALIMLLPTPEAVYVWAVAADRPAGFTRVQLKETHIDDLVGRLRAQFDFASGRGEQFDSATAYTLYDRLLAPLNSVWQGKSQLIVAASGALSQLPFAVLQTQPKGGLGDEAPWLIRQTAIAQVPSLSAWLSIKALAKSHSASASFMAWGDPLFALNGLEMSSVHAPGARSVELTRAALTADLSQLESSTAAPSALKYAEIPALPDTRDELLEIALALKANASTDVLLGKQATRESVLEASRKGVLASKRVIAFATHGLMAGDLPNLTQPALAMAATGLESVEPLSPLLTLEDVLTLKLNADWVVLSACNTAAAGGKGEETLSGLARGFFYAGSRSLLVTHWAVESESAKLLTTRTFSHYAANTQAPKAESLRQAMLSVMAIPKYQHPIYWAPYALVGDGGR